MLGTQSLRENLYQKTYKGYKTKKIKSQRLRFLQGIPSTGPIIAGRLLENFGNIKSIVNASFDDFTLIKGIGRSKANSIVDFFQNVNRQDE
jgi:ERCC4-type nuclease